MNELTTQDEFEAMWFRTSTPPWIVYFTASWCGPCKQLDLIILQTVAESRKIPIWKCDASVNDYTAGYCGVRAFPTFVYFQPKKVLSSIQSNDTDAVKTWIEGL
jgi:thioredoxin 1